MTPPGSTQNSAASRAKCFPQLVRHYSTTHAMSKHGLSSYWWCAVTNKTRTQHRERIRPTTMFITWKEFRVESQSAYEFPSGKEPRMKFDKAVFIRSGRRQRTTNIFWNGTRSRLALRGIGRRKDTIRCVRPRRSRIPVTQIHAAIQAPRNNLYSVDVG